MNPRHSSHVSLLANLKKKHPILFRFHIFRAHKTLWLALLASVFVHLLSAAFINWSGLYDSLFPGNQFSNTDLILEARLLPPEQTLQKTDDASPTPLPIKPSQPIPIKPVQPAQKPVETPLLPIQKQIKPTPMATKPLVLPPMPKELNTDVPVDDTVPTATDSNTSPVNTETAQNTDTNNTENNTDLPRKNFVYPPPNTIVAGSHAKRLYKIPKKLYISYETNTYDEDNSVVKTATSIFEFEDLKESKTVDETTIDYNYNAELKTLSPLLNTDIDLRYSAKGLLTIYGLRPLRIEESSAKKSMVATTIDPIIGQVVISSQEGFFPYNPNTQDLLSLLIQLGINQQTEPRWLTAGTVQDFQVYRPNGLTTWRFQSQGIETVKIGEQSLELLYIKRIPLDNQMDYEEEQHIWLDPNHYGFPVKMRFIRHNGQSTEFVLKDWLENLSNPSP
jgi:hypothetical protein